MIDERNGPQPAQIVRRTYLTYVAIILLWIAAWILKLQLDRLSPRIESSAGSFFYWTTAKILLWILPALWMIRFAGRRLDRVFNLPNYKKWLLWGFGVGLAITLTGFVPKYLRGEPIFPTEFGFALLNVLIIAPVFEEFLMRGAILGNLEFGYKFWTANIITSFLFIGLHLPGWYFANSLVGIVLKPVGGAFSIFLISLAFGYAAKRGDSVIAAMIAHLMNNLSL
jgi:CAAX protease family protein